MPERSAREFLTIIVIAFGYFIVGSFISAFRHIRIHTRTDAGAAWLIAYEILAMIACAAILHRRGWRLGSFSLEPTASGTVLGIALWIGSYALWIASNLTLSLLVVDRSPLTSMRFVSHMSWIGALALSIVNSVFEESLVTRYIVEWASSDGRAFALTLSAFVRMLYHVYQGPAAVLSVLPLGLLYAWLYWRWRRIWPLVVAHGLLDFIALVRWR